MSWWVGKRKEHWAGLVNFLSIKVLFIPNFAQTNSGYVLKSALKGTKWRLSGTSDFLLYVRNFLRK